MHICFLHSFSGSLPCSPPHVQLFALCTKLIFFYCYVDLLCAFTNVLKLNACRINAYSATKGIFSGYLASVRFRCQFFALCFDLRAVFCLIHVLSASTDGIQIFLCRNDSNRVTSIIFQVLLRISLCKLIIMQLLHRTRRLPSSPLA